MVSVFEKLGRESMNSFLNGSSCQRQASLLNPSPRKKHMEKLVQALQAAINIMYNSGHVLDKTTWNALDKSSTISDTRS